MCRRIIRIYTYNKCSMKLCYTFLLNIEEEECFVFFLFACYQPMTSNETSTTATKLKYILLLIHIILCTDFDLFNIVQR